VIGDIAVPEERGGFFGLYGMGPLACTVTPLNMRFLNMLQIGPAIGPVIGGGLADKLGWR